MAPQWLHVLSVATLVLGAFCATVIVLDEMRNPQHMWIMNIVWPVVALFGLVFVVWAYFKYGRLATRGAMRSARRRGREPPSRTATPLPVMIGKGTAHCGAGCTLGDIAAEWLAYFFPTVAAWLGWRSLFDEKMFAVWLLDYLFAFAIGIAFQYFTIAPMRKLGPYEGLVQAVKADALSLTAWQIGMYGFMAVAQFVLFRGLLGMRLEVNTPEFWFVMQIAMWCGFVTAYPVNGWLIRSGIKEKM